MIRVWYASFKGECDVLERRQTGPDKMVNDTRILESVNCNEYGSEDFQECKVSRAVLRRHLSPEAACNGERKKEIEVAGVNY